MKPDQTSTLAKYQSTLNIFTYASVKDRLIHSM